MALNFRFCVLFAIIDNKRRVGCITCDLLENLIFFLLHFAVLTVFKKYCTVQKRVVGEKYQCFFGFRMNNFICSKVVFHFSWPTSNLRRNKTIFFFKKRSQNFQNFVISKQGIYTTVGPILMIFFANC